MATAVAGCINDTKCIRYLLQSKFGFKVRDWLSPDMRVHESSHREPYWRMEVKHGAWEPRTPAALVWHVNLD